MRSRLPTIALWMLPSILFLTFVHVVQSHYRIYSDGEMDADDAAAVLRQLRKSIEGEELRVVLGDKALEGPMIVLVYFRGARLARLVVEGENLGGATELAAKRLRAHPAVANLGDRRLAEARIEVHLVRGIGPLLASTGLMGALAVHPAHEGVGANYAGKSVLLLPHELIDKRLLSSERPLSFIPDFRFGFARQQTEAELDALARQSGLAEKRSGPLFRFISDSFVETEPDAAGQRGAVVLGSAGQWPAPTLSAKSLREGALLGGRYLVAHLSESGRYIYEVDLATGRTSDPNRGAYSLPRHSGTTYFLAELYRLTKQDFLREPIERAIGHLADLAQRGGCRGQGPGDDEFICVVDRGRAISDLGSTALAVVALVEYQRATGDRRFEPLSRKMSEFLLLMQRDDGSFRHRYHVSARRPDEDIELMYYSGEAALALVRMHEVTREDRYLKAADRALQWLVSWYDFAAGGYFFGEEHWTCIAAGAAAATLNRPQYLEFCRDYGEFLRRHQQEEGDFAGQIGWVGSYYFTPFAPPQNTPAGSRTESMISTYELALAHGVRDDKLWRQIELAMTYALRQQFGKDSLYRIPWSAAALGAITTGPFDRNVRIDFVQHICSAMIRSSALLDARTPAE